MLESLFAGALQDSEANRETLPESKLLGLIETQEKALDAVSALAPAKDVHILAEIKRASPSKGDLASIPDPVKLALTYQEAGASAISVLTERRRFKGSLDDLKSVRAAVNIPLLRKDFISTEYQLLEARAYGADIFLLIVAGLSEKILNRLKRFGEDLGMTAFVETHSADEVRLAVQAQSKMLGVNARDLNTFQTDRNLFARLVDLVPEGIIKVAESAVRDRQDVEHYRSAGADVVLVGEALVTSDPQATLRSFIA